MFPLTLAAEIRVTLLTYRFADQAECLAKIIWHSDVHGSGLCRCSVNFTGILAEGGLSHARLLRNCHTRVLPGVEDMLDEQPHQMLELVLGRSDVAADTELSAIVVF